MVYGYLGKIRENFLRCFKNHELSFKWEFFNVSDWFPSSACALAQEKRHIKVCGCVNKSVVNPATVSVCLLLVLHLGYHCFFSL